MQSKIAAYITCYEDQESANMCIEAIEAQSIQVTAIYIVDNSDKPLSLNDKNELLRIHHYPNNIGIAAGLVKALEWTIDQKYDFLWTFDQDSVPSPNCLEILLTNYHKLSEQDNYKIGIIAPTACDTRTGKIIESVIFANDHFQRIKHNNNADIYECDSPITSGSLISLTAAKTICPPCADLFIDGIDLDYGLRLKQKGFHNLIVPKAIMQHNFGSPIQIKFLNQYRYIQQYSALRYYYICRNHTYLETHFSQGFYRFTSLIRRIKYVLIKIFLIMFYDLEDKQLKIWACLLGTYYGLIGKLTEKW
ncbi:glycosyltransferase family 2 protein [Aphanizomenon flos-aquae]|jgi:rhamnosyltransferase|uniref:glycosyltransferase family 2 protein n=1 Tax=Aphanizomenon flos-aquae TaxID=1176 RepID=UPI000486DA7D|nr:glycosyltransferase family 2 protein [Aphanizomenon flos-aquae]